MTQSPPPFDNLRQAINQYQRSLDELHAQLKKAEAQKHLLTKFKEQVLVPLFAPIIISTLMIWKLFKKVCLPIRRLVHHWRSSKALNQAPQDRPTQSSLKLHQRAILKTLRCRDAVEITLQYQAQSMLEATEEEFSLPSQPQVPIEALEDIEVLDRVLKSYELQIARNLGSLDLDQWRKLAKIDHQGSWWYIPHPLDQYDNLWGFLSIVLLTLSLVLAADLAPRFFKGGPNFWGALSAIVPAILTWLFSKDSVERAFQTKSIFENRLRESNTNKLFQQELIFVWSGLLFFVMSSAHQNMHNIAESFYQRSRDIVNNVSTTDVKGLGNAESNLVIALAFDPDHVEAHSLLGRIYTLRNDMQKAKEEYRIAAKRSILAQGRLKRLEVFEKKQAKESFYEIKIPSNNLDGEQADKALEESQNIISRLIKLTFDLLQTTKDRIADFFSSSWHVLVIIFGKYEGKAEDLDIQLKGDEIIAKSALTWESLEQYENSKEEIKKIRNKLEISQMSSDKKLLLSPSEKNDLEEDKQHLENESIYFLNRAKQLLGHTKNSSSKNPPTLVAQQLQVDNFRKKTDQGYVSPALPRCVWAQVETISDGSQQKERWKRCLKLACITTVTEEKIWQYIAVKELMKIAPKEPEENLSCGG